MMHVRRLLVLRAKPAHYNSETSSHIPPSPSHYIFAVNDPADAERGTTRERGMMEQKPAEPAQLEKPKPKPMARFKQAAGETAAECAVVFCCCPCGLANLILAAAVKLPAGLLRQAVLRRRKKYSCGRQKAGILRSRVGYFDDVDFSIHGGFLWASSSAAAAGSEEKWPTRSPSQEMLGLEDQMLAAFYGAGFWRSRSQKE